MHLNPNAWNICVAIVLSSKTSSRLKPPKIKCSTYILIIISFTISGKMLLFLDRCSRKVASNTKEDWFNPEANRVNLRISILSFCISLKPKEASNSLSLILIWRRTFWISTQRQIGLNWFRTIMSHRRCYSLGPVSRQSMREGKPFVALCDAPYTTLTLLVSASSR